jgi:hypothetical protein
MAKKGSKNNISNRGEGARAKLYDGKTVEPVELIISGKRRIIAAKFKEGGQLVKGQSGDYISFSSIH